MRKLALAAAAAVALFSASAANAASTLNFTFDPSASGIHVTNTSNPLICYNCQVKGKLETPFSSFSLAQGASQTFDFAIFTLKNWASGLGSAKVSATLGFTDPTTGSASTSGTGGYIAALGAFVGGNLTWNSLTQTQNFFTSNGSEFSVTFDNLSGIDPSKSVIDTVTIKAIKVVGGAVPEPATWAMMIVGLGMTGAAMRRQRRTAASLA